MEHSVLRTARDRIIDESQWSGRRSSSYNIFCVDVVQPCLQVTTRESVKNKWYTDDGHRADILSSDT